MNHSPEYNEVMAILKDVAERQQRAEKRLAEERQKDNERHDKEMARINERYKKDNERHEKVMAEHDKEMARMAESKKEADLWHKQSLERTAEIDQQLAELNRITKKNGEQLGEFTSPDEALENEFVEALCKANQIGEFNLYQVDVRAGTKREFDLVATNDDVVIVGEVKTKLLPSDVEHFITKRLPRFASDCPVFARNRLIYGMICSQNIVAEAEQLAQENGLFIARLENKEIIIDDVNVFALQKTS